MNKNQKNAFILVGGGLALSIFIHFGIMVDLIPFEPKYTLCANFFLIVPLLFATPALKEFGLGMSIDNVFKTAVKVLPLWLTIGLGVILVYSAIVFINYTYVNKPLADKPDMVKVLTKLNKGSSAATIFFYAAAFGLLNLHRRVKKTAQEKTAEKSQNDAVKQGRMEQVLYQDETRWLIRMLAVLFVLLGVQGVVTQYQRFCVDHSSISFIALVLIFLLFFLGYRLWRCSSIWNLFFWLFEDSSIVHYLHFRYCRISKHVRAGWIAGIISLVMSFSLHLMFFIYKGVWFWESVKDLYYMIFLPLKPFFRMVSDFLPSYVLFALFLSYVFVIGFVLGVLISYINRRFSTVGLCNTVS